MSVMTDYNLLLNLVRELGMEDKLSKMFVKKFEDNEKAFSASEDEIRWALQRGFFPGHIELYGLNEDNYRDYVPEWNYFMIHLNHHFKIWVNDKLTLKYVLNSNGFKSTMPEYYVYIENDGNYTYLMDAPLYIEKNKDYILNLLKDKGCLAMKPNSGTSGGYGFIKLELINDIIYENNKPIDKVRYDQILEEMRNYIVTEYIRQHSEFASIWEASECTLRVIMSKEPQDNPYSSAHWACIGAYARFGTSISGGASNTGSGGIGIGFDFETGEYNDVGYRYKKFCPDGQWLVDKHPDTGIMWKNLKLPNWMYTKGMIESVCQYISSLSHLGFDVIITNDGMKFCEINTHPAIDVAQITSGPALIKKSAKNFFENKGSDQFNGNSFYEAYMKSQK